MKFTAAATIAMAALVSAQSSADLPACAVPCIDNAVKSSTSCASGDYACICKKENFSAIQGAATSCVIEKCGAEKAVGEVLPATQKLCAAAKGGKAAAAGSGAASSSAASTTAKPSQTQPAAAAATTCPTTTTTRANRTTTSTTLPVTAGAAGFAPLGGLVMLAIGALAL